jgi:hypothetical protein
MYLLGLEGRKELGSLLLFNPLWLIVHIGAGLQSINS